MNFAESVSFVDEVMRTKNIVLGLDSMKELLRRLGNPQDSLTFIHIAGTNGKGSTLAMISSVCQAAGYRVGRYNSPSVFSYCEKIQINGAMVSEETVASYMTKIREICEAMEKEGLPHPTAFEIETALSFCYFKDEKCDLVALECGMGGETDATNVVTTTLISVIASISMDHMQYLGDTLEEIARVKGGIIKPGKHAVLCGQSPEVEAVIRDICEEREATLTVTSPESAEILSADLTGTCFSYKNFDKVRIPLTGKYQVINAVTALEVVEILRDLGYDIERNAVNEGMALVKWPGRFEVLGTKPLFVIDGAHNPEAALRLKDSVKLYFEGKRILFIMGILADKDYSKIVEIMAPLAERILTVTPNNRRALSADKLASYIEETKAQTGFTGSVKAEESFRDAVREAYSLAGEDDVILAFGSLSYLGELSEILKEKTNGSEA